MLDNKIIVAAHIIVSGIILNRQSDGNYIANVCREETITGVNSTKISDEEDKWEHKIENVKWDMRVGQEWLKLYPNKWAEK